MSYGAPNHPQTIDEPRPDVAKVMSPHLLINLLHTHERFACYLIALRNVFLLFFFVVEFFLEFFLEFCFFFGYFFGFLADVLDLCTYCLNCVISRSTYYFGNENLTIYVFGGLLGREEKSREEELVRPRKCFCFFFFNFVTQVYGLLETFALLKIAEVILLRSIA